MHLHGGDLCSGLATASGQQQRKGHKGVGNPKWIDTPVKPGTTVTILLDMDKKTISFQVGEGVPQLAYSGLPSIVHPYVCSGEVNERSHVVSC